MPRDNIERAVKRGTGELGAENFEEIRYEGYGPGGVAVIVHCLTDNRNRTVSEVRHVFTRYGGNLGAGGSVGYLFNHVGILCYPPGSDEDRLMEAALEAGAEDVVINDDKSIDVLTDPTDYENVREAMSGAGFVPGEAELTMRASTTREPRGRTGGIDAADAGGARGPRRRAERVFECGPTGRDPGARIGPPRRA